MAATCPSGSHPREKWAPMEDIRDDDNDARDAIPNPGSDPHPDLISGPNRTPDPIPDPVPESGPDPPFDPSPSDDPPVSPPFDILECLAENGNEERWPSKWTPGYQGKPKASDRPQGQTG